MAPPPHKLATMVGWSASAFVAAVLARLIRKGIALLAELDDAAAGHLRRLEGLLAAVWRVLDAADAGAIDSSQRPIQDLLDAAYSADDALDDLEYALLHAHTKVAGGGEPGSNASTPASVAGAAAARKPRSPMRFLLCFSPPRTASSAGSFNWRSSSKKRSSAVNVNLDGLREAFEAVAQAAYRCTSMYEHVVPPMNYATIVSVKSPGDAVRDKYDIFGREAEVDQIVKTVRLGDDLRYRLGVGVLPVVGAEGVGKTALAQLIFHHEIIKGEFPVRMWAHVSGELLLSKQLMAQMIHRVVTGDAGHDVQGARELLLAQLAGKRFLLVLDHVTDVSDAQWRDLMEVLQPAARRSLIIVTTQSEDVATAIGTMPPLILSLLAFDDYWRMFKHFAFGAADEAEEDCTPLVDEWDDLEEEDELSPMEQIACQIAKNMGCSTLPARAIGRSLYFRRDEEGHWKDVLDDNLWQQGDIGGISPALWLSYQHLDPRLKQCFAYSAVFPGDYVFRKEELEQMWVAHGFIYSDDPAATLEDVAGEFFDELVERCFFQPLGRNRYVMNNMMQKLSQAVSASQYHMVTDSSGEVPQEVRHLTITTNNLLKLKMDLALQLSHPSDHHFLQQVRTILFFEDFGDSDDFLEVLAEILLIAKSVRVLGLSSANISLLPAEIGLLRHLRYLNLSRNRLTELPEAMCQLHLLQVIDVKCNSPYLRPPNGMTNLINLRHLRACEAFLSAIPDMQLLPNLQELEAICIKSGAHANALRQMVQLKGALRVANLRRSDASGFKKGILKGTKHLNKLQHLSKLHLSWASSSMAGSNEVSVDDEEVFECLQPHENIKVLMVSGYAGIRSPTWMLKTSCSLPNVTTMYLTDCMNWESLPCLHDMPCLEVLEIKRMHSVNNVTISQLSDQELFPKLKRLTIEDALHFTGWSTDNSARNTAFPCLCKLEIRNCPSLTAFPDVPLSLTTMIIENVGLELLPTIHGKQSSSEDAMPSTSEEGGRWTSRLTTLHIQRCHKLRSLGSGLLQQQHLLRSLESLSIKSCEDVACDLPDGFKDLTALRDLSLYDCPKLLVDKFHASLRTLEISECFVAQGGWVDDYPFLFSVWVLKISGCSHVSSDHGGKVVEPLDWLSSMFNVYSLQLENTSFVSLNMFDKLHSLETLEMDGIRGAFFDGSWEFEWLEKLHTLSIRSCSELSGLPENLYTLPALEELCVDNCPAIQALPANGLPASLKRLSISKCSPELIQRCLDDELDGPKIAKVGAVYIDGQNVVARQE
ncbi:disease resistance protein RGA2-like [Hordeum vulgare subsp. vulgare]|uniref:Uncharacterized protein n=1 Tax=Hordeum vulgare subsp. vulgare TaxID=112509 RepID=M0WV18_HORVV|nr:disease resistance protein RGA2-like [Hordeum vulgare subsp. vulgare]